MKVALSIVAVLLAVDLVRGNIPVYSNPCSAVDQYYPYPNNNTKYIHCTSATTFEVMPCPAGTVWDQSQLRCEHPPSSNPTAAPAPTTPAPTTSAPTPAPTPAPTTSAPTPANFVCTVGTFSEDACELNVFYQCAHTHDGAGKWVKFNCSISSLVFSLAHNNTCVYDYEAKRTPVCSNAPVPVPAPAPAPVPVPVVVPTPSCANVAEGANLLDYCNYSVYYTCLNGNAIQQSCPPGLNYDIVTHVCDYPNKAAVHNPPKPAYCP